MIWTLQQEYIFSCKDNSLRNNGTFELKYDLSDLNWYVLLDGLLNIGTVEGVLLVYVEDIEISLPLAQLIIDHFQ